MNAAGGELPAAAGPQPARRLKSVQLHLDPRGWAELAPKLDSELRAVYWSLLALSDRGVFLEKSAGKLANLLGMKPSEAQQQLARLAQFQWKGAPLCSVTRPGGKLSVALTINNGVLINAVARAAETKSAATQPPRLPPRHSLVELIDSARGTLVDLAGGAVTEWADALLAALAEREEDGQLPGSQQVNFYRELTDLHATGGAHLADALREMLRRALPSEPVPYLRAVIERRLAEQGRGGSQRPPVVDSRSAEPAGIGSNEDEDRPRRTADGRLVFDDFDPETQF